MTEFIIHKKNEITVSATDSIMNVILNCLADSYQAVFGQCEGVYLYVDMSSEKLKYAISYRFGDEYISLKNLNNFLKMKKKYQVIEDNRMQQLDQFIAIDVQRVKDYFQSTKRELPKRYWAYAPDVTKQKEAFVLGYSDGLTFTSPENELKHWLKMRKNPLLKPFVTAFSDPR